MLREASSEAHKGSRAVVPDATHYVDIDAPQAAVDAIDGVLAQVK